MDLKKITRDIDSIPDCETLIMYLADLQGLILESKKLIEDEIADVTEEILAGITPISYVAYRIKKAKEKLDRLRNSTTLADLTTLQAAISAKAAKLGCVIK